jgi:hypothetical protein
MQRRNNRGRIATLVVGLFVATLGFAQSPSPAGFQVTEFPGFRIHHRPEDRGAAEKLKSRAPGIVRTMARDLGVTYPRSIDVWLAGSEDDYRALQANGPRPEWSVGVAYPDRRVIVLYSPRAPVWAGKRANFLQVFTHELAHVVLADALGGVDAPHWLQEGYAKLRAGEMTLGMSTEMTWAYVFGRLIPLRDLIDRFPRAEGRARLAYAESLSFVAYLLHEEREPGFHSLLARLAAGQSVDEALRRTTGKGLGQLEDEWLTFLALRYTVLRILVDRDTLWAAAGIIILLGWLKVRRRQKRKLAAMAAEEARAYGVSTDDDPPTWVN